MKNIKHLVAVFKCNFLLFSSVYHFQMWVYSLDAFFMALYGDDEKINSNFHNCMGADMEMHVVCIVVVVVLCYLCEQNTFIERQ